MICMLNANIYHTGMAIAVMVGYAPVEAIDAAFQLPSMFLPKVPGLGLCLGAYQR